jgi:hypothetical protein
LSESADPNDDFESQPFNFLPEFVFDASDGKNSPAKDAGVVPSCDVLLPPLICDASRPEAGDLDPNDPEQPSE